MNGHQQEKLTHLLESRPIEPYMVDDFFNSIRHPWRMQDRAEAYGILLEYVDNIETEQPDVAASLREGYNLYFENTARKGVRENMKQIVKIPHDTRIDCKYLNGLGNDDFVTAFDSLQEFLIACYSDIARAPFEWGYPCSHKKLSAVGWGEEYRLRGMLANLFSYGEFDGYGLTVDKKAYFKNAYLSNSEETKLMLDGFTNMGLIVEGLDSKSKTFYVSFPDNANMLCILPLFFAAGECSKCWEDCPHIGKCYGNYPITRHTSFSYRFFEDKTTQTHEAEFLIALDSMPEHLREIHLWLYEEAKQYGFDFDPFWAASYGCISYNRGGWGGKHMPFVGMHGIYGSCIGEDKIAAHTTFKRIFKTHPGEIARLMEKFPDSIGNHAYDCPFYCGKTGENICKKGYRYKIDGVDYHSCGYKSFLFMNPTFDDVKWIVELWKLENQIELVK